MIQLLNPALEKYQFCLLSDLPAITQSLYFTLLRRILVNYRHLGLKIHDFYAERNLFHRSSMLLLFKLSFVLLVFLFALFGVCFFACLFYQKHGRQHHPHADSFLFCFVLEQMRLRPLLHSVLPGISFSIPVSQRLASVSYQRYLGSSYTTVSIMC